MGVPMKTKVQGVVKACVSGDTVIIVKPGVPKSGPPPEVKLSLSSIKAPSLKPFSAGGESKDEPYAWAAREFLRRQLVGKNVTFVVEYEVQQLNRSMGTIFCPKDNGEYESVSKMVLKEGLARVRRPNNPNEARSFEYEDLCALEEEAEANKVGLFRSPEAPPELGRKIIPTTDTLAYLAEVRGKPVPGSVDYIMNGSAMKVLLPIDGQPGSYRHLTVCLSGVQSPGFRRAEGTAADEEEGQPPRLVPMPFALNAKFFTETRLLQRDVELTFEGADKTANLYAQISLPNSPFRLAEELLRNGLARTVGWSMEFTPNAAVLRATEKGARDARLGIWHDYKPNPNASVASTDVFYGKVVEIVSADTIVVNDEDKGQMRRISFASIRAPKLGRSHDRDQPMAWEGREYLRNRLIGRRVKVAIDYSRKALEDSPHKEPMFFASISREKGGKENGEEDIGTGLVAGGYVTVIRHRSDEERARHYEDYVQLEKAAMTAKKGVHSEKPQVVRRVNDLTGPDNKKRAKEMLSSFADAGPHRGILEYASTASRFRVYLPKESCLIGVALRGVRSPTPSRNNPDGTSQAGQPFGDEALHFTKLSFLQRDVVVHISSVDKAGAYLGTIRLPGQTGDKEVDVGLTLLTHGYGMLNEFFDPDRDEGGEVYVKAQEEAQDAKKGLWRDYDAGKEKAAAAEQAARSDVGKVLKGRVVEIGFGGKIVIHAGANAQGNLQNLEAALSSLSLSSELPAAALKSADVLAAKYSDGNWYRCKVVGVDNKRGEARVRFIDYGMDDWLPLRQLTRAPPSVVNVPKLATEVSLLHIVVPGEEDEWAMEAGETLRQMVYDRDVEVEVVSRNGDGTVTGKAFVDGEDVAALLLRAGVARIVRQHSRASKAAFAAYAADEEKGKQTRACLWQYGDPYGSDEDETEAEKEMRERRYGGTPRR